LNFLKLYFRLFFPVKLLNFPKIFFNIKNFYNFLLFKIYNTFK
jgi:hypothetical protein